MNNKNFCVAPFKHVRIRQDENFALCCYSQDGQNSMPVSKGLDTWWHSEYLNSVRKSFLDGIIPEVCYRCVEKEQKNLTSLRQILNNHLLDENYCYSINAEYPISYDIKLNNTCNLSCPSCEPRSSSVIQNEWEQNVDKGYEEFIDKNRIIAIDTTNRNELIDQILQTKKAQYLKFIGGEPFVNKKFLNYIYNTTTNKKEITLEIVTNGTIFNKTLMQDLTNFKHLILNVSVDGLGKTFELLRYGADWQKVKNNIKTMQSLDNSFVTILNTVSAASVATTPDLVQFAIENNINVEFTTLVDPDQMKIEAAPTSVRLESARRLRRISDKFIVNENNENLQRLKTRFKKNIYALADSFEGACFDKNLNNKLHRYFSALERVRSAPYLTHFEYLFESAL